MRTRLEIYVQPNAKKNEVILKENGSLKIKIAAPPQEGKANRQLVAFLAEKLKIKKSDITVIHGESSRTKLIEIRGLDKHAIMKLLTES